MDAIIPDRVTERRKKKELSQVALAKRCGVKAQSIQQLEAGKIRSPRYIVALVRALDTTPEYLCGKTVNPELAPTPLANGGESPQVALGNGPNDEKKSGALDEVRLRLIKKIMELSPSKLTALDVMLSDDEESFASHPHVRGRA